MHRHELEDGEARARAFLAHLDRGIADGLAGRRVSCSKGCAHCCYMLTECGIAEALYAATEVARWPDLREVARTLFEHAAEQTQRGMWKNEWFERHVACPFLTGEDLCRIYARRPVACRCHVVLSPPENCALGAKDTTTTRFDAGIRAIPLIGRVDLEFFRDYPSLGEHFVGLFPHMVLHALQYCVGGADRRWVEKRLAKLPHPRDWMFRSVREQKFELAKLRANPLDEYSPEERERLDASLARGLTQADAGQGVDADTVIRRLRERG